MQKFNDVRDGTIKTRQDIGFLSDYRDWQNEPATFTQNTLVINGHPVMEDWEDSYMRDLAQIATQQGGRVLEVGYGMGISARYIQEQPVDEHIIIEANADVFKKLETFAAEQTQLVTPQFGFWQDVIAHIPDNSISGILFDTYPLTEEEVHQNHFSFFDEAYRILKPNGVLTYYSDEIDDFSELHLEKLMLAGFTDIKKQVCDVLPPTDCEYWKSRTILAPIITK